MPDLELLRKLAPPVEAAAPGALRRAAAPPPRRSCCSPRSRSASRCSRSSSPSSAGETFAEAAIRAAEASPRLLVEGWEVTRVDEWSARRGRDDVRARRPHARAALAARAAEGDGARDGRRLPLPRRRERLHRATSATRACAARHPAPRRSPRRWTGSTASSAEEWLRGAARERGRAGRPGRDGRGDAARRPAPARLRRRRRRPARRATATSSARGSRERSRARGSSAAARRRGRRWRPRGAGRSCSR